MRILPLLCATALLSVPAKADKFWFGDPAKQTVPGSKPDMIEGVLIDQDETSYHVRVVGGELVFAKSRVFKIEKTALTLDAIVKAEEQNREQLARDRERRALDRAAARLRRDVQAAEAAASRRQRTVEPVVQPVVVQPVPANRGFDPVIGRVSPGEGYFSHQQLLADLELAWSLTNDRRYLTALRRLRRLH